MSYIRTVVIDIVVMGPCKCDMMCDWIQRGVNHKYLRCPCRYKNWTGGTLIDGTMIEPVAPLIYLSLLSPVY